MKILGNEIKPGMLIEHKDDLLKKSDELNWYPKSMKI